MSTRHAWIRLGLAAALSVLATAATAQAPSETLVGRGDKVTVIHKDGAAEEVTKKDLAILNRSNTPGAKAAPARPKPDGQKPAVSDAKGEGPGSTPPGARAKSGKSAPADEAKRKAEAAKQEAEAAAKERAEAIKKSNIEQIRKLQWEGAWFYDKKGNPISAEELDKRVEKGNVADIQATDIYLQNWNAESAKPPAPEEKP